MRLYHYTTRERAAAIFADGFRDSEPIPSLEIHAGVWFSDVATTQATGQATGRDGEFVTIEIDDDLPPRFLIAGSPGEFLGRWREFCIPASIANGLPRKRVPAGTQLSESHIT